MRAGETAGKSFLFAMFHGGGNVHLILPVAARLTARGHRVRVLAGPRIWVSRPPPTTPLLDAVIGTGATALPLRMPSENPHDIAPARRGLLLGWTPARLSRGRNLGTASWWAPAWADAMADELARECPDVAVADYYLLGAIAAAERAGVPTAVLVHNAMYPGPVRGLPPPGSGFGPARYATDHLRDRAWAAALRRVAIRDALPSLNRARANLGLNQLPSPFDQYDAAARVLILCSRGFDFPSDRLPSNVRYVGTPFDEAPPAPWQSPWPADDRRPLVLVSLSTLDQGQGPLMHRALGAIAELPVRALVTLGPSLAVGDFKAPPNAKLEVFVPHAAVLPGVAAVVTQCGLSTVTKALAHGLPLVCIPLVSDQPDNAARIVAAGAGIRLSHRSTTAQIAAAIERVLVEERFREGARRMAALMALERGADTAADELERLASGLGA
jgi:MGT family glycosyltransferase